MSLFSPRENQRIPTEFRSLLKSTLISTSIVSPPASLLPAHLVRLETESSSVSSVFSFRIDPMIDGLANTVVETDILASPHPTGSEENWAGNAFITRKKVLETTGEAARDADPLNERGWSIAGTRKHYAFVFSFSSHVASRSSRCSLTDAFFPSLAR